ncbi:hypothetical protein NDA18_002079 [Ustilago nuda]|nr:hypothetical protein NDA18_002079 [Ustilago nuda]
MSHSKVLSHNTESSRLLQQEAQEGSSAFDVASIDNLLVFWPDRLVDLTHLGSANAQLFPDHDASSSTYLIGHVVHGHPCQLAVVVVSTLELSNVSDRLNKTASYGLNLVGTFSADQSFSQDESIPSSTSVWLTAVPPSSPNELPSIKSVRFSSFPGPKNAADSSSPRSCKVAPCTVSLISYSLPNTRMLQYFALESLRLAPVSGMKLVSTASALLLPHDKLSEFLDRMAAASSPSKLQNKFMQLLMLDPVRWRSQRYIRPEQGRMPRGTALRRSIELINQLQARLGLVTRSWPMSTKSTKDGVVNGSASMQSRVSDWKHPVARLGSILTSVALAIQRLLRHPLYTPKERVVSIGGLAHRPNPTLKSSPLTLTSISACARQLDVRISQLVIAPRLASRLRYFRKQQKLPIDYIAAPYIGLWNAIWLIANDIILGHAISVLLLQNKTNLSNFGRGLVERYWLERVLWLLSWLENWPAGLKLNTELTLFFSDAYSSLSTAWHLQALVHVLARLEIIIVAMSIMGRLTGVTMVLCMMQDLVSICTLHITIFYTLSFKTLRAFIYVLPALFDVFRGKKRNALRGGRLDDASYELDQLLLGTLLFTLVAFLFPTVYVYYLAFALIRFAVVAFQVGVVETGLGLLNHLPLFALMLRFKDPHRLPAGVWMQEMKAQVPTRKQVRQEDGQSVLQTSRYKLRSRPLAIGDIFEGYGRHVGGLFELPGMLLRCIFGRPLRSSTQPLP